MGCGHSRFGEWLKLRHCIAQGLDNLPKQRGVRFSNSEDMGLLSGTTNSPPVIIIQSGQLHRAFVIGKVNKLLIRKLRGKIQFSPQPHTPKELATTFERLGELDEQGGGQWLWINWIFTIQDGIKQAERRSTLAPGLLCMCLSHFILKPPLAGIESRLSAVLDGATMEV
ncbi:hypothetical protein DN613_22325 [Aeromonas caviae]|nr:hypothetical protein DN613_22325 [Aeromonas caviae]